MSISSEKQRLPSVVQQHHQPPQQPSSYSDHAAAASKAATMVTTTTSITATAPPIPKIIESGFCDGSTGNGSGKKPLTSKIKSGRDDYRSYGAENSPSKQPLIAKNQSGVTVNSFEQQNNSSSSIQAGKVKRVQT